MSLARRFGISILVGLLTLSLVTGNLVAVTHETVLDPGFANESLSEENVYGDLHETIIEDGEFLPTDTDSLPSFATDAAGNVITPEYLQNQTEANVGRLYAYLHGNRENPGLRVDLRPAVDNVDEAVAAAGRNASIREITGELAIGGIDQTPVVNRSMVLGLTDGPVEYERSRAQFRDAIRGAIIDEAVDQAFEEASNDQLLVLVGENPLDYDTEAEKEAFIEDNEDEIRAALRQQIVEEQGDEIDQRVGEAIDERSSTFTENVEEQSTGTSDGIDREVGDLLVLFVDGLTAEDLTYEEFRADLDTEKADLAVAIGEFAESEIETRLAEQDGVEDGRLALTGDLPADTRQQLSDAQSAVGVIDISAIVVPLVVLVLIGLLWLLSSVPTAALWTGVAALFAGVPGYLAAEVGGPRLEAAFVENAPQSGAEGDIADAALGVVEGVLGQLAAQSLWLTAAGGLLVVTGAALRLGVVDDHVGSTHEEAGEPTDDVDHEAAEAPDEGPTSTDNVSGEENGVGDTGQEPDEDGDGDVAGGSVEESGDAGTTPDDGSTDPDEQ